MKSSPLAMDQLMPPTSAEKLLRSTLKEFRIKFRVQPGADGLVPTVILPEYRTVVFVDPCLEGRCPTHYPKMPRLKRKKRVLALDKALRKKGWVVIRFWAHEVEANSKVSAWMVLNTLTAIRVIDGKGA